MNTNANTDGAVSAKAPMNMDGAVGAKARMNMDGAVGAKAPQVIKRMMDKNACRVPNLSPKEILTIVRQKCVPHTYETFGTGKDYVIFLPKATEKLYSIIDWGERTPTNHFEQVFQGMGHVFVHGDVRINVITHVLMIYAAERTPCSARIIKGKFDATYEKLNYEKDIYNHNELKCNVTKSGHVLDPFLTMCGSSETVLSGHTHPGLTVFFSPPDKVSGFATPSFPASLFVADPINMDMKAAVGVELRDAQVIMCKPTAKEAPKKADSEDSNNTGFLVAEITKKCNEALGQGGNVKGKCVSYKTIFGGLRMKINMRWKPEMNEHVVK